LSDSEQLGTVPICFSSPWHSFIKTLNFLGYNYNESCFDLHEDFFKDFCYQFQEQKDIFEFLASSNLFNKKIFAFENLNQYKGSSEESPPTDLVSNPIRP
jgi:hypothetical protein